MSKKDYQRFGKYLILDHLVDGGMAKICRASYLGEQANKIVAIKMVQPQYSKNPSFVQMFEDELKVTFGLSHPNIAQVHDYGLVDEQLYSAMEYVDGANLKQFLDRLKELKFVFPVEISTFIISQVSLALHYAHTFQDKLTGKPFNIIHRDISPHNIMLTYDGAIKVIDFGIAKADSNSEATQAGTIKGKLSYLAPEYLEGLELDHRYDQFAVGITLWEMLCSRKLFTAKNDLAVLKQIQSCKVPKPSSINPNVPEELDQIVLKALSKDRNQRYENMDKLNRALVKFLYSNFPEFNATDLGYFAKQLFKKEIASDKKKFVEFGKIDIKPFLDDIKRGNEEGNARPASIEKSTGSFVTQGQKTGKIVLDLGTFDEQNDNETNLDLDFSERVAPGSSTKTTLSNKKVSHKTSPSATKRDRTSMTDTSRKTGRTRIKPGHSVPERRGSDSVKNRNNVFPSLIVAGVVMFAVIKPEVVKNIFGFDLPKLMGQSRTVASSNTASEPGTVLQKGIVRFDNLDSDMRVLLNGKSTSLKGLSVEVEMNKAYDLIVTKPGYKSWKYKNKVELDKGNSSLRLEVPEMERDSVGFLTSSQNFSVGSKISFKVDGELVEKILPLVNERVPAGTYDATISNPTLQTERKIRFTVQENKRNFLK